MKQHRAYKWEVLALLWVAYLLNQADRQVFNTVLPAIRDSLGLTDTSVGLIATVFNLFYACMVPLGGWAGDRFSRKWVTTLSILFWSVATMFTGLANGVVMLVLMRSVATGGGEAFFGPANYSLLGQYHTDTRARAMSIHQTSYYVGVILAGWLAGKIADSLGWKSSFIIFGAAGILWGIVMILRLRDHSDDRGTDASLVQPGTAVPDAESFTPSGEYIQNCSTSLQSPAESTATETASAQQLTKVSGTAQAGDCRQTESCRQHSPEGVKHSAPGTVTASAGVRIVEVTPELYNKIAYRGGTEGIMAEVRARNLTLEDLALQPDPLIVVLESIEKPGNLGAVLRSADAAGADAVIICDPLTDLYNPNLIRSSLGGIFTVPCVATDSPAAIAWLKAHGIRILTAQLQDSDWYYDTDMRAGTAIVIGTESTGLTDSWRAAADAHIRIPMLGRLDSLNASVSAAILLFEAVRQRHTR